MKLKNDVVVLPPSGVFPQQMFCFLSRNKICIPGDNQRFYQRQRRGTHITWLEWVGGSEPQVVSGGLDARLEEVHRLRESALYEKAVQKYVARAVKAGK